MRRILAIAFTCLGLTAADIGATVSVVQAQDLELRIDRNGPNVRMLDSCDERYEDCRDHREYRRRGCSEDRALEKAEDMGLRRVRIVSAGRRTIEVRGRDRWGDRVYLTFGRERGCPLYN